jgi:hypothetical protein
MDRDLVCTTTWPVDGNALVLEQVRESPLYRRMVVNYVTLLRANKRTNVCPRDDDLSLSSFKPGKGEKNMINHESFIFNYSRKVAGNVA